MACQLLVVGPAPAEAAYPPSEVIAGIRFQMDTLRNKAPGNNVEAGDSDNWTITWADDDQQYTAYGDGVGFRTGNATRASLGVARIEGGKDGYKAVDLFQTGSRSRGWGGKSVGIVAIDGRLYLFRNGTGSAGGAFKQTELYQSTDRGRSWAFAGVRWTDANFTGSKGFFSPTFLQFGRDYSGARDEFVYVYAPEETDSVGPSEWNVQNPGRIALLRVPRRTLTQQDAYEYFSGFDTRGGPVWSSEINRRVPVFEDPINGVMRTSVNYNAGLKRYVLITQQVNVLRDHDYHIGIYEAPEPWGPWRTILFANAERTGPGLNTGSKTVYWNFSNKWSSPDGRHFVLVYTGPGADQWGTVEGAFIIRDHRPRGGTTEDAPDFNLGLE